MSQKMSNNDKFIRDTEFGKLMESGNGQHCNKCKYEYVENCLRKTNYTCDDQFNCYFAKDETDENKNLQNLQK